MKVFSSTTFAELVESAAQAVIGLGTGKKRVAKGAQVEAGATNEYRHPTSSLNVFNYSSCLTSPVTCSVVDSGGDEIDQMMRNSATFGQGKLGSRNLDALINLDRVTIYYLTIQSQGYFDPERAFAGSSRANYCN